MTEENNGSYGTERFGRLRRVMLHRPSEAIWQITEHNRGFFLFDAVPDADNYLEEHYKFEQLLKNLGVQVHLLQDHVHRNADLMRRLPNLAYLHDIAQVSSYGAILSKMSSMARQHEEVVVREALENLGIPSLYEPAEGDAFEGCLLLSPTTLFVADTERHGRRAIESFIGFMRCYFEDILYAFVPQERRFMHPDMVLNRVTERLMLWYPEAFLETYHIRGAKRQGIDFHAYMKSKGIDLFAVSGDEQRRWGTSFVPLEPGVVINYDISLEDKTVQSLEREGVRFIHFHPEALLAGGGSLRCLTLRLHRE